MKYIFFTCNRKRQPGIQLGESALPLAISFSPKRQTAKRLICLWVAVGGRASEGAREREREEGRRSCSHCAAAEAATTRRHRLRRQQLLLLFSMARCHSCTMGPTVTFVGQKRKLMKISQEDTAVKITAGDSCCKCEF